MIKASAILLIALCVTWLLRRRPAAERHVIWAAAIISAAFLPTLSLVLPAWQPRLVQRIAASLPTLSESATGANPSGHPGVIFRADGIDADVWTVNQAWFIVWIAGSIAGLFFIGRGIIKQRSFARRSEPVADTALAGIASDIALRLGCRRRVQLRQCVDPAMPMTWGVLRPQVLLPKSAQSWPAERNRVVIAHEFAHVRRLDWLFQMLARIACAVYWFNPLFWIACDRLYRESEHACDDTVVNLEIDPKDYATHLLEVARALRQSGTAWSASLAVARQSTLEKRFAALLNSTSNRRAMKRTTVMFIAISTLALAVPLAAVRLSNADLNMPDLPLPAVEQYTSPPLYSDDARAKGIEGIVTVEVRVGVDGSVKRLQVVKGLGHGLDENALVAVRDWRFVPARRNGISVETATQIDVEFSLRTAELNELIANDMATRVGPGVIPPQVVHRVEPRYSHSANRIKPAGSIVLDAVILEDGTPRIVRVIRSLDWELDEVAINAVKQWRFSPAMKDGKAVKVRMNVAVDFSSN